MNRQIGVADSKYVVSDDPLQPGHVIQRMRIANFAIKMAHHILNGPDIAFSHNSPTDQGRRIEFGSQYP